jgi:hypothetical protein
LSKNRFTLFVEALAYLPRFLSKNRFTLFGKRLCVKKSDTGVILIAFYIYWL